MRLLQLVPSLSAGGAERQLHYLAQGLTERAHEVHVAYIHLGLDSGLEMRAKLHRIAAMSNYDPVILVQLWRLIARIQPDIVQTWIMQMDILGGLVCWARGQRWIIREPNSAAAYRGSVKFRAREWVARWASAIVCNSRGGQDYWLGMRPGKPIFVIGNGLPFDAIARAPRAALSEVGLDPRLPTVLYAGRLVGDHTSDKNLKLLVAALRVLLQRVDAQAVLCGDGPQRRALEEQIEGLGLRSRVKLAGHLPRELVWGLMRVASVFVSVSRFEGMPNAVMEAMAAGCPLVVSDIGAHREFLTEDTAVFVPDDSAVAIAEGMSAVLSAPDAARLRAAHALEQARHWSLACVAAEYEKVYDKVAAAGRDARG